MACLFQKKIDKYLIALFQIKIDILFFIEYSKDCVAWLVVTNMVLNKYL